MGQTSLLICIVTADTATSKNARFKKKQKQRKTPRKLLKYWNWKDWNNEIFFFFFSSAASGWFLLTLWP